MLKSTVKQPHYIAHILPQSRWQKLKAYHKQSICAIIDPYLQKKEHHKKDPVLDFLFQYYTFRPSHLKKWSPGLGVMLSKASPQDIEIDEMSFTEDGAYLHQDTFPEHRKKSVRWILTLLQNSTVKNPSFGCFGMHEWAMVYKAKQIRHNQLPLRMTMRELAAFVDSRPLVCTHFDAFRFFTEDAKPQNKFALSRQAITETEQPGCLHTNMDLYKWAFKMYPWVGSEIIRQAFLLAVETRTIDMKASPYDLSDYNLEPIKIETEEGRLEYLEHQKDIYHKSIPIREQLIHGYNRLMNVI